MDVSNNTMAVRNHALTGNLRTTAAKRRMGPVDPDRMNQRGKHYHSRTTYTVNYTYITLFTLSILASLIYIAIRVYYIANGVMRQEIPSNTMVVDTATCVENNIPIDSDRCSNKNCGKETALCSTIQAGDLLATIDLELNDVISFDDLAGDEFKGIREIMATHTYSYWWSLIVLAAEIGGFVLVHLSQQMFIRQDTKFYEMTEKNLERVTQVRMLRLLNCNCVTHSDYSSVIAQDD
jgi:hypothetical protein